VQSATHLRTSTEIRIKRIINKLRQHFSAHSANNIISDTNSNHNRDKLGNDA